MAKIELSGFTFIKHGIELGYPFLEAVECLLAFCDEVIVSVGFGDSACEQDDGTYAAIIEKFSRHQKLKIIKSYWDPSLTKNGEILAKQTDIAFSHCTGKYCQYLQADEHIHEVDFIKIRKLLPVLERHNLDGVIFEYLHFYGNVDVLKFTRKLYRREVRLIRNDKTIRSYRDAQGFRFENDGKLTCLMAPVCIFHYGWARKEMVMRKKIDSFGKIYHGAEHQDDKFVYQRIWGLCRFQDSHPAMMSTWILQHKNNINILDLPLTWEIGDIRSIISDFIEKLSGIRLGEYKNYHIGAKFHKSELS